MPARLIRLQQTGHSHFITFTCYRRMQFLTQERACSAAVQSLKSASARVARRTEPALATAAAHFWQTRYYDRYMRDYAEFSEKLRYIHRNPVKRGLCAAPEEWHWSSFRHYCSGIDVGVEIESEWTARAIGEIELMKENDCVPQSWKSANSGPPADYPVN